MSPIFDLRLLDILVCPASKTRFIYDPFENKLINSASMLSYSINDGIPVLLLEEAEIIDEEYLDNLIDKLKSLKNSI